MKTALLLPLLYLLIPLGMAQSPNRFSNNKSIDDFFALKSRGNHPLILAHRGGPSATDTENSITTFDKTAKQLPNAIIEMDVRMTVDSNYVLLHDPTLDRVSDANGPVADKTLSELKKHRLKTLSGDLTDQSMPTFAEVLQWNKNRYMLALDVKPGTDPLRVMRIVESHLAVHSVFVICYSMAEAQRMRDRYPTLWLAVGINNMADLERLEKSSLASGRLIVLTPQKLQPISFYERLHKLTIPASVGTYGKDQLDEKNMNDAATGYRDIVRQGGDILTTDRPVEVSALF